MLLKKQTRVLVRLQNMLFKEYRKMTADDLRAMGNEAKKTIERINKMEDKLPC